MKRLKRCVLFLSLYSLVFMCSTMPMAPGLIKATEFKLQTHIRQFKDEWPGSAKQIWKQQADVLIKQLESLGAHTQAAQYTKQVAQKMQEKPAAPPPPTRALVDNAIKAFEKTHAELVADFERYAKGNRIINENHRVNFEGAYRGINTAYQQVDQAQLAAIDRRDLANAYDNARRQVATLQVDFVATMITQKDMIRELTRITDAITATTAPHQILDTALQATNPLAILQQNGQLDHKDFRAILAANQALVARAQVTPVRNQLAENFDALRDQYGKADIKVKEDYKVIAGSYAEILGFLNEHFKAFITGEHKTRLGRIHPLDDYDADIEQWK